MSQWLEQVIDTAQRDDYLSPVRQQALAQLKADGWPARETKAGALRRLRKLKSVKQSKPFKLTICQYRLLII